MTPEQRGCLPRVSHGYCFPLQTCCKILAYLAMFGSFCECIRVVVFLVWFFNHGGGDLFSSCKFGWGLYVFQLNQDYCNSYRVLTVIECLNIVFYAAVFVLAYIFLKGVNQRIPEKMIHFIRLMWINLILGVLTVAMQIWTSSWGTAPGGPTAGYSILAIVLIGYTVYCLICANSFYYELVEEREKERYNMRQVAIPPM